MRARSPLVALCSMAAACLASSDAVVAQNASLENAIRQLHAVNEADVRQGAAVCVERNDVPGVEALLEVFTSDERRTSRHLHPAHYRDVVWDSLIQITDPYARKRVEEEARNSKDPHVRQWCLELLGIWGDTSFAGTLMRAMRDDDPGVRRWAARGLGTMRFAEAAELLEKHARDRDPMVRANAIEALARIAPQEHSERFVDAVRDDSDAGVRCALLGALPELFPARVEDLSVAMLEDDDWRPRIQAVENLADVRTKTAVDALIAALDDGRPVVAERALESLQQLTGRPIRVAATFERWWKGERENFEFPETSGEKLGTDPSRTVTWHGIRLTSDHVAFLIDKSYAMRNTLASGQSKDAAAQAELARVLEALEGRLVFNVHNYEETVESMSKRAVELGRSSRRKAVEFVTAEPRGRAKDIWQVLEMVVSDPEVDTAYLLSSGEPDVGLYVHWNRVTRHLADLNRFQKVVIHAVAYTDNDWHRQQLEKITEVTGGDFEVVE